MTARVLLASASAAGRHAFLTESCGRLLLDQDGVVGDRHYGASRLSGPREPWLPRGTRLRNDRQVSALCPAELAVIAERLEIPELRPEWLGGNLLVEGLSAFSQIAPGSRLAFGGAWAGKGRFDGGAVVRVEAYNSPCRLAGRAVADAVGRPGLEFAFVKAAANLRGLVLSVDRAGPIEAGDPIVLLPPIVPRSAG